MKDTICAVIGIVGSTIAALFGGWDAALATLVLFMGRKGVTLLIVLVACRLDTVMGSTFIRDAVVIAFIANETISIVENAGLMWVPIPAAITKAIDILKQKAEEERQEEG